jgi:hypothetical protein
MEKHVNENPGKKDQMSSLTVGVKYNLWKQKLYVIWALRLSNNLWASYVEKYNFYCGK